MSTDIKVKGGNEIIVSAEARRFDRDGIERTCGGRGIGDDVV